MANADLVATVRTLHVLFGIFWLGLVWTMAWILPPVLMALRPESRMDLMPKLGKRLIPIIAATAGSTLVLGFLLFYLVGPATVGIGIHLGMTVGLVMFLIATLVVMPTQKRMIGAMEGGSPPAPADLGRSARWATINAWLGVLVVLLMVLGTHAPLLM